MSTSHQQQQQGRNEHADLEETLGRKVDDHDLQGEYVPYVDSDEHLKMVEATLRSAMDRVCNTCFQLDGLKKDADLLLKVGRPSPLAMMRNVKLLEEFMVRLMRMHNSFALNAEDMRGVYRKFDVVRLANLHNQVRQQQQQQQQPYHRTPVLPQPTLLSIPSQQHSNLTVQIPNNSTSNIQSVDMGDGVHEPEQCEYNEPVDDDMAQRMFNIYNRNHHQCTQKDNHSNNNNNTSTDNNNNHNHNSQNHECNHNHDRYHNDGMNESEY